MCPCTGKCNCNSTTIPRGPQGVQGPTGPAGSNGAPGSVWYNGSGAPTEPEVGGINGDYYLDNDNGNTYELISDVWTLIGNIEGPQGNSGNNGQSSFTLLTAIYVQPAEDANVTLNVVNSSWMAVDEILFVGPSLTTPTDAGGFYQVVTIPTSTSVVVKRLSWVIPDTTFEATGQAVGGTDTVITPTGTIGPQGQIQKILDEVSADARSTTSGASINNHTWTVTDILTDNQDSICFDFVITPLSGNGRFDPIIINIGGTDITTFSLTGSRTALEAAQIKFDVDPTDVPAGYTSSSDVALSEDINIIKGKCSITRRTALTISYDFTYYLYNGVVQETFPASSGNTRMIQKIFNTLGGHGVSSLDSNPLTVSFTITPDNVSDGFHGSEVQIYNAIKYAAI